MSEWDLHPGQASPSHRIPDSATCWLGDHGLVAKSLPASYGKQGSLVPLGDSNEKNNVLMGGSWQTAQGWGPLREVEEGARLENPQHSELLGNPTLHGLAHLLGQGAQCL